MSGLTTQSTREEEAVRGAGARERERLRTWLPGTTWRRPEKQQFAQRPGLTRSRGELVPLRPGAETHSTRGWSAEWPCLRGGATSAPGYEDYGPRPKHSFQSEEASTG